MIPRNVFSVQPRFLLPNPCPVATLVQKVSRRLNGSTSVLIASSSSGSCCCRLLIAAAAATGRKSPRGIHSSVLVAIKRGLPWRGVGVLHAEPRAVAAVARTHSPSSALVRRG
jgi:hypothetical protein